jgi:hypothetical protein
VQAQIPEAHFVTGPRLQCGGWQKGSASSLQDKFPTHGRISMRRKSLWLPLRMARGIQNKVLEALAMGLPCVTSSAVWPGTLVRDGEGPSGGRPEGICRARLHHVARQEFPLRPGNQGPGCRQSELHVGNAARSSRSDDREALDLEQRSNRSMQAARKVCAKRTAGAD